MSDPVMKAQFYPLVKTIHQLQEESKESLPYPFRVESALIVPADDYMMFCEDMNPEYPFLQKLPANAFDPATNTLGCVLLTSDESDPCLLFCKWHGRIFTALYPFSNGIYAKSVPCQYGPLEQPPLYVDKARFYYRPASAPDLTPPTSDKPQPMQRFVVEKVIMLSDEQYAEYTMEGFQRDCEFLFDNRETTYFDPADSTLHCLLVKSRYDSRGILVECGGTSYTRYAAFVPDCSRLNLRDVPTEWQYATGKNGRKLIPSKPRNQRER